MRKHFLLLLLPILLCGCAAPREDPGLQLRSTVLEKGCSFDAEITADYGDSLSVFTVSCQADPEGAVTFTVSAPEGISGISGTLAAGSGKLHFADKALSFPLLADGLLAPVSAPWIFVRTLRAGNLIASGKERELTRLSIDDSFRDDALRLDIWLNREDTPVRAEILSRGQKYLSLSLTNFRTESDSDA